MLISYPILPLPAANTGEDELDAFARTYVHADLGTYPVSRRNRWHGGIHLNPGTEAIRAIADGEVVAYRCASATETYEGLGDYDTSFVLLKHSTETGEHTPVVFYSLYMHLKLKGSLTDAQRAQLPAFLRDAAPSPNATAGGAHKVYRKDVLGFGGKLYQHPGTCVHFEIFATDDDFQHFWKDSKAIAAGGHGSDDFFGDAGFVIPAGKTFAARHPHADTQHRIGLGGSAHYDGPTKLPVGHAGTSSDELCVSVRLEKGQRTATSYRKQDNGDYVPVGTPVTQVDYEYEIFRLASHLYTDCPSAGYEWLRFGRVLGPDTTTTQENWQLIRYGDGAQDIGYIDLAASGNNVSKLSDADFPHWLGWTKVDDGDDALPEDGICDVPALQELLHIPTDADHHSLSEPPDFASRATDPAIAKKLRYLVCKFRSEWDDSNLDDPATNPYERLKQAGQPLADTDAWTKFKEHVKKMAFWSSSGLTGKVWHFHPLQAIQHYRKCLWLSTNEFAQCIPRRNLHLVGTHYTTQVVASWANATQRATRWHAPINRSTRKYGIADSSLRLSHFLSQMMEESGYIRLVKEGNGEAAPYAPYYGRGLIQLTHQANYKAYGDYRNFPATHSDNSPPFSSIGWNPNTIMAQSNSQFNAENCADSAGFYWTNPNLTASHKNALDTSDHGSSVEDVIGASRATNGNVPIQNINGLSTRIQSFIFLKYVLMDYTTQSATENVVFDWRRSSNKEPLVDSQGQPIMDSHGHQKHGFVRSSNSVDTPLDRQRP